MRQATQSAVQVMLQNDPTVDNRLIGPALDLLKGKTAMELLMKDVDRTISRRQAAEILNCSLRSIDELGRRKKIKKVRLLGKRRGNGYSLQSVRLFQLKQQAR